MKFIDDRQGPQFSFGGKRAVITFHSELDVADARQIVHLVTEALCNEPYFWAPPSAVHSDDPF